MGNTSYQSRKTHLRCAFITEHNDEQVGKLKEELLYQGGPIAYIQPCRKETVTMSTPRNSPLKSAVRYIQARRRVSQSVFGIEGHKWHLLLLGWGGVKIPDMIDKKTHEQKYTMYLQ